MLGFGCMRFPTIKKDGKDVIDREKSAAMLDMAIKSGVNYIDTAYPYHNGESELFLGEALKAYPRDSFYLATKLPMWDVKEKDDVKRLFNKQLEKLQTDYIDFYLLHGLNAGSFKTCLLYTSCTLSLELIYLLNASISGAILNVCGVCTFHTLSRLGVDMT